MAGPRARAGLSGVAVLFAAIGGWVVYAAVRDTDPVTGLADLLSGKQPTSRSPGGSQGAGKAMGMMEGGGSGSGPNTPVPMSETVLVRQPNSGKGIRVHKSIALQITKLLADAMKAGFNQVGGGGWRSNAEQRALRIAHGYLSDSEKSGSNGRTPTAVPGTSRHESGTAIDFTNQGRSLTRSDPFYQWLTAHAGSYGLRNLPSEAWHWSTDGH
jgi:hypothetical protein